MAVNFPIPWQVILLLFGLSLSFSIQLTTLLVAAGKFSTIEFFSKKADYSALIYSSIINSYSYGVSASNSNSICFKKLVFKSNLKIVYYN